MLTIVHLNFIRPEERLPRMTTNQQSFRQKFKPNTLCRIVHYSNLTSWQNLSQICLFKSRHLLFATQDSDEVNSFVDGRKNTALYILNDPQNIFDINSKNELLLQKITSSILKHHRFDVHIVAFGQFYLFSSITWQTNEQRKKCSRSAGNQI